MQELNSLRKRVAELEQEAAQYRQMRDRSLAGEERFRSIFDNSLDAILLTMPTGEIISANRAAQSLLGMSEEEICRGGRAGMVVEDEAMAAAIEAREKTGKWRGSLTYRRKDGSTFPVEVSSNVFEGPAGRTMTILIFRDMREQRRAEEGLRESEERFRLFMDNSPTIAWIKDGHGRYVYLSKSCEGRFGVRLEDWIGKTDAELWPPEIAGNFRKNDLAALEGGSPVEVVEHYVNADGSRSHWLISKFPFCASGKPYVAGIGLDITEQKKAEDELKSYREQLEALVKQRTQELENKTHILEELNAATRALLRQREEDRKEMEDRFVANVKNLILPYAEKMKRTHLDERQQSYLGIMETHFNEIMSPLMKTMQQRNLTPTESQVASLIKDGKTTKEIAAIMGVATSSIDTHRKSIRRKLGLNNMKANLQSHLQSIGI